MNISKYISGQFQKPTGIGGKLSTFIMNRMNQAQYRGVINSLSFTENERVLDIGFGNGYLINRLAEKSGGTFYGIDISEDMVKAASKRSDEFIKNGKVHLTIGNALSIPFEDSFFDKIYTVNTVYFWKDIDKGLSEIRRVLKPDGIFIDAVYSKQWLGNNNRYTKYGFSLYTIEELKEASLRNGLNVINIVETKKNASYCIVSKRENV